MDAEKPRRRKAQPGDLHVWAMATSDVALTAHLVLDAPHDQDALLRAVTNALEERFGIRHVTVQLESADCPAYAPGS